MKTINKMISVVSIFALVLSVDAASATAQVSSRELSVDAAFLTENGMPANTGMLPPTAGQGAQALPGAVQGFVDPAAPPTLQTISGVESADKSDKKARVYQLEGKSRIGNKEKDGWEQVQKDMMIIEGTTIITSGDGQVSITFDEGFQNVMHIPHNTRVEFKSIEPTDVFLEDGTVFNMFDGLAKGSNWTVTTPTAVAAVRGTWYLVTFTAADGSFITATIDVPTDGKSSSVDVIDILENGSKGPSVNVPEGNEIKLEENQKPDPSLLEKIDSKYLDQIAKELADILNRRNEGKLPPTAGEAFPSEFTTPPSGGPGLDQQVDLNGLDGLGGDEPPLGNDEPEIPNEDPEGGGEDRDRECELFGCGDYD